MSKRSSDSMGAKENMFWLDKQNTDITYPKMKRDKKYQQSLKVYKETMFIENITSFKEKMVGIANWLSVVSNFLKLNSSANLRERLV